MTTEVSKGPMLGIRHLQAFLIFLSIVVSYVGRLNVAVAVVAMTDAATTNPDFPEYEWSSKHKSYILSSFYWGYVITQFPGGYMSRRFGAKITMFISICGSAAFSLITPFCIPWGGWQIFCAIRIVQGLFQGLLFPCIHAHLAKWSPLKERNRLGALSHTGIECGTVLAMYTSGIIAHGSMGWPGISYISAGIGFGWCVLWLVFAANNAPESKFITVAERTYIESSLQRADDFHAKSIPIPWVAIFTSVPFYALLVARCAEAWGFSTIQAEIPSYMNGVLKLEIKDNALYSALPYLTMWVLSYVYLISADIVLKKKLLSLTALRKTINTIALWIPAAALIGVGFVDEDQKTLAIVLLTISVGINGGATIGSSLNTIDLSPNHAGILMGIVNTIANFIPIITPLLVGIIVTEEEDRTLWQIVFIIAAVIFFFGNLVYIIWGSALPQPWNEEDFLMQKDGEKSIYETAPPQFTNKAFEDDENTKISEKSETMVNEVELPEENVSESKETSTKVEDTK
ncbi:putative inorganic phosphate cotransporter [Teleopsis dalmanni]|uniref:putative inorganic phosphate cotransporter n=1 Tax=Teleopsis dalmanni TaxID=139649 RepID=UPI000D329396|nr:putative inorganic phosphate cotransporter [Teleopsis dalmanni]